MWQGVELFIYVMLGFRNADIANPGCHKVGRGGQERQENVQKTCLPEGRQVFGKDEKLK